MHFQDTHTHVYIYIYIFGPPPQGHPSLLHTWGRRRVSATLRVHSLPSRLRGALKVCDVRMSRAALARQAYRFLFPPGRAGGKSLTQTKKKSVVGLAIFLFIFFVLQKQKPLKSTTPFFFFCFSRNLPRPGPGGTKNGRLVWPVQPCKAASSRQLP